MKELTPEQIVENWNDFIGYIDKYITGNRKEKLKKFYEDRAERLMYMPASSNDYYHSAFSGGFILHCLGVIKGSIKCYELWKEFGSSLNCTLEEVVFTAINHDLGKYGTDENEFYRPNPSEWHRKNQGKIYEHNDNLAKMPVPDRSIFLLQQNGIQINENEFIGIKTHDGLYDEGNKGYLLTYGWSQKLKSALPYIVHQADIMAARIEFEDWRDNYRENKITKKLSKPNKLSNSAKPISDAAKSAFDEIFKS